MLILFETISRNMHRGQVPHKRVSRTRRRIYAVLRFVDGITITGGLFAIAVVLIHTELLFILLPTALSVAVTALTMRSHVSTIRGLLFTVCLALLYFAAITSWELFSHAAVASKIVLVTTTLAAAVILEPVRAVAQSLAEQRFHLLDDTTSRTIDAFTGALREEINLDQVRDRFIQVIQATMQPQFVTLWGSAGTRDESDDVRATSDVLVSDDRLSSSTSGLTFSMYDPIVDYALRHLGAIEVTRVRLESDAVRTLRARDVEVAMPLISQGKLMGLVALGPRLDGEEYSRDDRRLLNTLTAQAAPALRTAQLVLAQQAEVRERERIEQELRIAQQIQRTFLPKDTPVPPGWRVLPYYQPARQVGGDFYDFLRLADGRLGIVIGDVSGKGIPAALVMSSGRNTISRMD